MHNKTISKGCQLLSEEMDSFHIRKNMRYVLEKHCTDVTLSRRMRALELLFEERNIVQKQVESCLPDDPNVKLLEHIPGVGRQTAVQLMSMIVDIGRFEDSEKFCAYFGLVPRVRDSDGKGHHGWMTKTDDRVRRMLMTVFAVLKKQQEFRARP